MRTWYLKFIVTLAIGSSALLYCSKSPKGAQDDDVNLSPQACTQDLNQYRNPSVSKNLPQAGQIEVWAADTFYKATNIPFSFDYNQISSSHFLYSWNTTAKVENITNGFKRTLVYTDPVSKLEVRAVATSYTDKPSIEWTLWFKNTGTQATPLIKHVLPLDAEAPNNNSILHFAKGGVHSNNEFQNYQINLSTNNCLQFSPSSGRSSDPWMPFFNINGNNNGWMIAIGWSGQWQTRYETFPELTIIRSGMEKTDFSLNPGEEVRTPSILVIPYTGDWINGQNLLRAQLLGHYLPSSIGSALPIAGSSSAELDLNIINETNQNTVIDDVIANNLPINTWWIDAGWFVNGWDYVGTWLVDTAKYPNGLHPIAQKVQNASMKFLLWFEPERVTEDSSLANDFPQWLLGGSARNRILDLGNPQALTWAKSRFSSLISSEGVDIFRLDFNIDPLSYWQQEDLPSRVGIKEMKYVAGLYDFLDYLLTQYPNLIIDGCASGGRRIDIEMLKRTVILWPSDNWANSNVKQGTTYGLSLWVPQFANANQGIDKYSFRSSLAAGLAYMPRFSSFSAGDWSTAKTLLQEYQNIQSLFLGDFYPITPYSVDNTSWMAMQFQRNDLSKGMLMIFRRAQNPQSSFSFLLKGLDSGSNYKLTDLDTNTNFTKTGSELMTTQTTVTLSTQSEARIYLIEVVP